MVLNFGDIRFSVDAVHQNLSDLSVCHCNKVNFVYNVQFDYLTAKSNKNDFVKF